MKRLALVLFVLLAAPALTACIPIGIRVSNMYAPTAASAPAAP